MLAAHPDPGIDGEVAGAGLDTEGLLPVLPVEDDVTVRLARRGGIRRVREGRPLEKALDGDPPKGDWSRGLHGRGKEERGGGSQKLGRGAMGMKEEVFPQPLQLPDSLHQ